MTEPREMNQIIAIAKDIVFNENEGAYARLSASKILIEDACLRMRKIQIGLDRLYAHEKSLIEKLIAEYKEQKIVEFMVRFGDKELTPEMVVQMKRANKPAHCFSVEGLMIIEKDCNLCHKRSCELAGNTLNYKLIEEDEQERPMDGLDDEIPPEDIAKDMEDGN